MLTMNTIERSYSRSIAAERILRSVTGILEDCWAVNEEMPNLEEEYGIMRVWAWMEAAHHVAPTAYVGIPFDERLPSAFIRSEAFRMSVSLGSAKPLLKRGLQNKVMVTGGPFLVAEAADVKFCEYGKVKLKRKRTVASEARSRDWQRLLVGPPLEVGVAREVVVSSTVDFTLPRRRKADD